VCRYEFRRDTKVDFPAPAIPIVIIVIGFFLAEEDVADEDSVAMTRVGEKDETRTMP